MYGVITNLAINWTTATLERKSYYSSRLKCYVFFTYNTYYDGVEMPTKKDTIRSDDLTISSDEIKIRSNEIKIRSDEI